MNGTEQQISGEFLAAALRVLTGDVTPEALDDGPLLMTVTDAARRLGVARSTVGRAIRARRLKKVEIYAGSYRLRCADVEALAAGLAP